MPEFPFPTFIVKDRPDPEFILEVAAYGPHSGPPLAVREIAQGNIAGQPYKLFLTTDHKLLVMRVEGDTQRRVIRLDDLMAAWVKHVAGTGKVGLTVTAMEGAPPT